MRNSSAKICSAVVAAVLSLLPSAALAALPDVRESAGVAGQGLPGSEGDTSLIVFIGGIIHGLLGALGIVFLILVIYAGALWMTAGGEAAKVDKAKKILTSAAIGLIVVMASYGITSFVVDYLQRSAF